MGWFDDDDDDDDEEDTTTNYKKTSSNGGDVDPLDAFMVGINSTIEKEEKKKHEEEDPLDAFMGNLQKKQKEDDKSKKGSGGRMDFDNEEEATAHWTEPSSTALNDETAESSAATTVTSSSGSVGLKAEMANTFHRAGQKPKPQPTAQDEDLGEEEERLRKKKEEQFEKSLQTKINHSDINYPSFQKSFWINNNSNDSFQKWRNQHSVQITSNSTTNNNQQYDAMTSFQQLTNPTKLPSHLFTTSTLSLLTNKLGYKTPTPIQAQTIPIALTGNDILLTAATGSGKTLSYLLTLLIHVCDQPHIQPAIDGPIGLILVPTRELAAQVYNMGKPLFHDVGGKIISFMGGQGKYEQLLELKKGAEVVVSTPGRLIDLFLGSSKNKGFECANFRRVTFLVLDEADKMLDMGFEKQVTSIMLNVRPDRQCMMLSATFGKRVERSANGWLCRPVRIAVGRTGTSSEHVTQHVLVLPSYEAKKQWLIEMFPTLSNVGRTIIFVASRADCEEIAQAIRSSSPGASMVDTIHGDKDQRDRNKALLALKKGKVAALVATDVAARGLDVRDIMTVVNFDVAKNMDSHVHRVGRAGRMMKEKNKKGEDSAAAGGDIAAADHGGEDNATGGGEYQRGSAYTLLTPKNADFANLLMESFEREGREVSHELASLAMRSKRYGGGRSRRSKSGLGFQQDNDYGSGRPPSSTSPSVSSSSSSSLMAGFVASSSSSSKRARHGDGGNSSVGNSYYGPASSQNHNYLHHHHQQQSDQNQRQTPKRSRWGR